MAKKYLTPIDLAGNELRNAVVQNLGSAPGTPSNGQIYYLTTGGHDLQVRLNGTWTSVIPATLLGTVNTWTANQTINASILGNGTIALTGAGASSVGGTMSATAHISTGLTGAVAASRYVGATASGAPSSGTFVTGDFVVAQNGAMWVCTSGGTPGTWVNVGASGNLVTSVAGRTGVVTLTAADIAAGTFPAGNFIFSGTSTATAQISSGLTGATSASRYVGATASGAPGSGTFVTGDFIIAQNGAIWICTAGGTPGTWVSVSGAALTPASSVVADTTFGASSVVGTSTNYARQDHSHGSPTHVGTDHSAISISSLTTPTGDVAWGSHKITGLLDPTGAQDAATKNYVDNSVAGLAWKDNVAAATTAALATNAYSNGASGVGATLTATSNGALAAIDGYTPVLNDRLLVKNEATAANNGIYVVTQVGSGAAPYILTRATDADAATELQAATVVALNGTTNGMLAWTLSQTAAITVGTTALNFVIQSGANAVTAGSGLASSGNVFNVGAGTGISVAADSVAVDTTVVARKFTQQIGNGSLTSIAVTHSLGNQWVNAQVFNTSSPFDEQECDIQLTDANTVTLLFTTAPSTNALRVVVTG